jgi:predicted TPR repeat methyltransferase
LRFQLASITGEEQFEAAPAEYVTALFDNYAETFDRHLRETLKYRAPELLVEAIKAARPRAAATVVDLGCGTGLCGPLLRPIAKHLTGIDLSQRMIGQARQRGVYDELLVDELTAFLNVRFAQFDVAIAADVFGYIGELRPILSTAAQALRVDGLLGFTVEKHEGEGFILNPTRRYAHSIGYIRSVLGDLPLEEVSATEAALRIEKKQDVRGWIIVLRRRGT